MNIDLFTLVCAELAILLIIGLHGAFLGYNGTPRMRRTIDTTVKVGQKVGAGFIALVVCSLVATATAIPLLKQLTGTMKHVGLAPILRS